VFQNKMQLLLVTSFLPDSLKRAVKLLLSVDCKHKYSPCPRTGNTKCFTDPVPGLLELVRQAWAWGKQRDFLQQGTAHLL